MQEHEAGDVPHLPGTDVLSFPPEAGPPRAPAAEKDFRLFLKQGLTRGGISDTVEVTQETRAGSNGAGGKEKRRMIFQKSRNVAQTPPMGWNSWDCFAANVTEEQLMANARYVRDHLKAHGWQYVVCDIQWSEPLAGTEEGEYRPFAALCLDEYGRQIPAENRFPSSAGGKGFGPIADEIHARGLKFGIPILRGIPRQAVHAHLPVLGTGVTADKIASPFSISKWNGDMYGVDASRPGAQAYYDSIFRLYAEWGVDFVKVDDICNTNLYVDNPYSAAKEVEMIAKAIAGCGREMVLSLSPGPAVIEEAWHLKTYANMWRMTDDFWDKWEPLKQMFYRCELWQAHVGPGSWPDCDMLPLGKIGIGFRSPRMTNFTKDEQRTMLTLWCVFRSPLMVGGDLPQNDDWTLSLLTNDEVIAVNQQGANPRQLDKTDDFRLWASDAPDGGLYLAGFNLSEEEKTFAVPLSALGLEGASVRDLWTHEPVASPAEAALPAHGSFLWKLK